MSADEFRMQFHALRWQLVGVAALIVMANTGRTWRVNAVALVIALGCFVRASVIDRKRHKRFGGYV